MNISELKDLKLTEAEWHALMHMGELEPNRAHMDMLVLAGLAVRTHIHPPEWDLTEDGHAACNAVDLVLDWDDFVFCEAPEASESPSAGSEEVESVSKPQRMTVGSLVRHTPTGGTGLITEHTMYDADWGGFYVDFVKPVDNIIDGRVVNKLHKMFDRADMFEHIS